MTNRLCGKQVRYWLKSGEVVRRDVYFKIHVWESLEWFVGQQSGHNWIVGRKQVVWSKKGGIVNERVLGWLEITQARFTIAAIVCGKGCAADSLLLKRDERML